MKAVLVIDVDEKSIGREVNYIRVQGNGYSYIVKAVGENVRLRPLPEVRDVHCHYDDWELERIKNAESRGFNWCIDEIMGETE